MRGDGVVNGDTAQEIAPKGVRMVAVKLRRGGLLHGGECVGRRGGPQLSQALRTVALVLLAEVFFLLRSAPFFALARYSVFALLGVLVVGARAGGVLQDAAKGLRAVVRLLGRGVAEVDEVARLLHAVPRNQRAGLGERLGTGDWTCSHDSVHMWEEILPHPLSAVLACFMRL